MNQTILRSLPIKTCTAIAATLAFTLASAAGMSRDEYSAAKDKIEAQYKSDKTTCDSQAGNAKDVCVQEAKGKEDVAKADLEYRYSGKDSDRTKIAMTKADADYSVAKERCDDQSGEAKSACVSEAKAMHEKAKADVKANKARMDMGKQSGN